MKRGEMILAFKKVKCKSLYATLFCFLLLSINTSVVLGNDVVELRCKIKIKGGNREGVYTVLTKDSVVVKEASNKKHFTCMLQKGNVYVLTVTKNENYTTLIYHIDLSDASNQSKIKITSFISYRYPKRFGEISLLEVVEFDVVYDSKSNSFIRKIRP